MKVSALIITYNQEKSLATAVESALMQTADFDFEVVVAEDHSTDGTRARRARTRAAASRKSSRDLPR